MIWTILNLLCLVLVGVYLAVCLIKQRGIGWGAILLLPVLASGALFFFHFTTWLILLLAGVGFAMLRLGKSKGIVDLFVPVLSGGIWILRTWTAFASACTTTGTDDDFGIFPCRKQPALFAQKL